VKDTTGKVCPRCGGVPHLTPAKIARGAYTCFACQRAEQTAYRAAHKEEGREQDKRWRAANPELCKAIKARRLAREKVARAAGAPLYKDDPVKLRARYTIKNEIKRGRLRRGPCARCGDQHTHGHHEDYSKPFEVAWLCRLHHAERHREIRDSAISEGRANAG